MFRKGGLVFFGLAATVPLLLQLAGVAKAFDGIVVTPGQIQPVAEFSCSPKTNTGYKAEVFSSNPMLPERTYDMERDIVLGWFLDGIDQEMSLRFNGKLHRGDKPTGNRYVWIDTEHVQVEFIGETKIVPLPTNPQQAQQQGGDLQLQHQYPLCLVNWGVSFSSGLVGIFQIVVDISLKPLQVRHPGVITTVDNPPQIVGHFTWAAAAEGAHDGMVKVTSTSDSLPSRAYKVKLDPKHGWILQEPTEIYVLVPNGELYRERVGGGGGQHAPGGHVERVEVIGTYEWDRGNLGYVKVSFKGDEAPKEGEHDADPIYKVTATEFPPHRWHIMVSFTLKPRAPPITMEFAFEADGEPQIIG